MCSFTSIFVFSAIARDVKEALLHVFLVSWLLNARGGLMDYSTTLNSISMKTLAISFMRKLERAAEYPDHVERYHQRLEKKLMLPFNEG